MFNNHSEQTKRMRSIYDMIRSIENEIESTSKIEWKVDDSETHLKCQKLHNVVSKLVTFAAIVKSDIDHLDKISNSLPYPPFAKSEEHSLNIKFSYDVNHSDVPQNVVSQLNTARNRNEYVCAKIVLDNYTLEEILAMTTEFDRLVSLGKVSVFCNEQDVQLCFQTVISIVNRDWENFEDEKSTINYTIVPNLTETTFTPETLFEIVCDPDEC